ncbi:MAG: GAF domain-containing protein [Anaerolineaceae bacterium]|nr:GAF domain-containing protein [Anaerolineaceae bacterium]
MATATGERILVVENDAMIADLVARQALQSAGYQVTIVADSGAAISHALQFAPDMILADLDQPGLNARDLIVALSSRNVDIPVVVLAQKPSEGNILQSFRLGAADFILWPAREAEVINVVERVLGRVRERRERDRLARQLQQTNQELQQRVHELTTIFSIGKAVTSTTTPKLLFEKILEAAVHITKADLGWFQVKEDQGKLFVLAAQRGLPPSLLENLNKPWDDGISSLVAMSGEPLAISGDTLKRLKISSLGESALIVPVKAQKQIVALLVVMRKQARAFSASEQRLLEAAADYAAISLVNAALFRTVENHMRLSQYSAETAALGKRISDDLLQKARVEIYPALEIAERAVQRLMKELLPRWTNEQRRLLAEVQKQILALHRITADILVPTQTEGGSTSASFNLSEVVQQYTVRFRHFAQQNSVTLVVETPAQPVLVQGEAEHIAQAVAGLLSNAIRYCQPGGRITVTLTRTTEGMAQVVIENTGEKIDPKDLDALFSKPALKDRKELRFGGFGVGLPMVKEIITRYRGKLWADSNRKDGARFTFTLPLAK